MSDTAGARPPRRRGAGLGTVLVLVVLAASPSWAAFLESPAPAGLVSGIGFISGWKCAASNITVTINDGEHLPVAMYQERSDLQEVCGSIEHGFIKQVNWAWPHISDGEHVVVAYDEGVEFGRSTFTVGSTGEEFVEGVTRRNTVKGFPAAGEIAVLEWNESTQHFELLGIWGGRAFEQGYWEQLGADLDWSAFGELARLPYSNDEFLYAEAFGFDICLAGRLTQAAKGRALDAMNQIRALHGLSAVQYSSRYDEQMQAAALIHAAGGGLHASPPPPSPSDQCYTEAGAEGSRTSSQGSRLGINGRDPAAHIAELTERGGHIRLGPDHQTPPSSRRWILNPFATYMSYGQTTGEGSFGGSGFYALKVFGFDEEPAVRPQVEVDYVAFPYQIYPFLLMEAREPWSFSVVEDKTSAEGNQHPYFESATVSVTRVEDGARLPVSGLYTDTEPIGVANVLSWQVKGWRYDILYQVDIRHVAMQSGETRSYSYPVFIERDDLEELTRTNREEQ